MAPQLAYLGIGLMGQAMTKNIVAKAELEKPLILWNRTQKRAEEHSSSIGHSTVVATVKEAVTKADIIWSCLQDQEAVTETFEEIFRMDIRGKLFLESSTVLPDVTNRIAKQIEEAGAEFVAMPVFGEPSLATIGKLICVPAGPTAAVARIKPYLIDVVAQAVVDLSGEEAGKASLLKIIGNVLIMTTMETCAEINVFAEKTGLGVENAQKLIDNFPHAAAHTIYSNKMLNGDYYQKEPMVEVHKARHLTSQVLDLAKENNVSLKSYKVAVEHLADVENSNGPKEDICGIYGTVRMESGLDFYNNGPKHDTKSEGKNGYEKVL
ncbi:hypothetical protein N7G274_003367 [Stereocaulon virgatum]|uniref:6-phosphogluconate dehydrogenase NADP-binding domain-containing protein n=1 Tax=Stereocaulon virgatum TaxID=373712 RepID=A0ABR4AGX4_9LECA